MQVYILLCLAPSNHEPFVNVDRLTGALHCTLGKISILIKLP